MAFVPKVFSSKSIARICNRELLNIANFSRSIDVHKAVLDRSTKSSFCLAYPIASFSSSVSSFGFKLEVPYPGRAKNPASQTLLSAKPDLVKTTDDYRSICFEIKEDEDAVEAISEKEKKEKQEKVAKKRNIGTKKTILRKRRKAFEKFEDDLIVKYVEKHGCSHTVFKFLVGILKQESGADYEWKVIRLRYYRIRDNPEVLHQADIPKYQNKQNTKTPFTKKEDELIIEYIDLFGMKPTTLNRLCTELRRNKECIRARFYLISSNNKTAKSYEEDTKRQSEWTILDDRTLIECVFRVNLHIVSNYYHFTC